MRDACAGFAGVGASLYSARRPRSCVFARTFANHPFLCPPTSFLYIYILLVYVHICANLSTRSFLKHTPRAADGKSFRSTCTTHPQTRTHDPPPTQPAANNIWQINANYVCQRYPTECLFKAERWMKRTLDATTRGGGGPQALRQ